MTVKYIDILPVLSNDQVQWSQVRCNFLLGAKKPRFEPRFLVSVYTINQADFFLVKARPDKPRIKRAMPDGSGTDMLLRFI